MNSREYKKRAEQSEHHHDKFARQQISVCYFGTYRAEYSRNQIMIEGLRRAGIIVNECHENLWYGIEDRVQAASGGWIRPAFWLRVARTYFRLIRRYFRTPRFDILVVGYPGQFDVFLARILSYLRRRPLAWDIFMSIYLIALERDLEHRSAISVKGLRWIEYIACRLPDLLILDTSEYVKWFGETHHIPAERFRLVPTGADERVFQPVPFDNRSDKLFRVLYYGTYIPNHGVPYIVEAAHILQDQKNIAFIMVGDGPEKGQAMKQVEAYHLKNIQFIDWLEKTELVQEIAQADLCLGAFGTTPQSLMTVQNKIYECMAMAKPVISGDSPAVRQVMTHREHIYLCERSDPKQLALAIRTLISDSDLRNSLAVNGHTIFQDHFTLEKLGKRYRKHLQEHISN